MGDDLFEQIISGLGVDEYLAVIGREAGRVSRKFKNPDSADGSWSDADLEDLVGEFCVTSAFDRALLKAAEGDHLDVDRLAGYVYRAHSNHVRGEPRKGDRANLLCGSSGLVSSGRQGECGSTCRAQGAAPG